jgi:hypothetical protein
MATYLWAERGGKIVEAEYNRNADSLTSEQVYSELVDALNAFGNNATCTKVSDYYNEVYDVSLSNEGRILNALICIKEMTPGGRSNLNDEQRIQQKSKHLSYAYGELVKGKIAINLGVYKRDGETIFCAWKLKETTASSPDTPISKQIKIHTIAQAMRDGFAQQEKDRGELVCAFRKEFIFFYIKNAQWIHDGKVNELVNHTPPIKASNQLPDHLKDKYNRIVFGSPGTGKSYRINAECKKYFDPDHYERITFHPQYSYAHFVGTYKPITTPEGNIVYKYVPGPFIRVLVKALQKPNEYYLLIIEEINRANVAAVFGDVFQLLDRKNGISEYPIETSEDLRSYLSEILGSGSEEFSKLYIPPNMYIWATMNSADQGVFPMDTAFKRRWDFEYIDINEGSSLIEKQQVEVSNLGYKVYWDKLRREINKILSERCKINEDKLIGPFFLGLNIFEDTQKFNEAFKNKLLMYLYEDAAKHHRRELFSGCDSVTFSSVCEAYDKQGEAIFGLSLRLETKSEAQQET